MVLPSGQVQHDTIKKSSRIYHYTQIYYYTKYFIVSMLSDFIIFLK